MARLGGGWTHKKNARRCYLIHQKYGEGISEAEEQELNQLQEQMLAYRRKVAPLPLEELRKLHAEVLTLVANLKGQEDAH